MPNSKLTDIFEKNGKSFLLDVNTCLQPFNLVFLLVLPVLILSILMLRL